MILHLALMGLAWTQLEAACLPQNGCNSLAHYVVMSDVLYSIGVRFGTDYTTLQSLNGISNPLDLVSGQPLWIPFHCDCGGDQLGHNFSYAVAQGDTPQIIASTRYGNLTTVEWIDALNANIQTPLTVPVNCSCGNPQVSKDYGFFATYVAQANDTLASISKNFSVSEDLLVKYNPNINFDSLQPYVSIIFFPMKNSSGMYPPLDPSLLTAEGGGGVKKDIIGGVVAGVCAFLAMAAFGVWFFCFKTSKKHEKSSNKGKKQKPLMDHSSTESSGWEKQSGLTDVASFGTLYKFGPLSTDSIIEFSYEELAAMTENFSVAKEIGRGGFATVYYGEYQGQKLAIKKMDTKESKGFVNELRVLTSVHHTNLVRLVGYCTKTFLFLVYEFVEKGSLSHHLRFGQDGTQVLVLSWEKRVQIALDAARGIEYLHDHTTPTYVHRDIKPNNILLDKDYNAKVGDFGLTKLTDPEGMLLTNTSKQGGTYGYLAPEYAQFGHMSSKADVYAFGVVLFQIVSGKEAIVDAGNGEHKQLASLFEDTLNEPNAIEKLHPLVDPALRNNYSVESVWKMVNLAERCTRKKPELRPLMREVVLELTTISQLNQT